MAELAVMDGPLSPGDQGSANRCVPTGLPMLECKPTYSRDELGPSLRLKYPYTNIPHFLQVTGWTKPKYNHRHFSIFCINLTLSEHLLNVFLYLIFYLFHPFNGLFIYLFVHLLSSFIHLLVYLYLSIYSLLV